MTNKETMKLAHWALGYVLTPHGGTRAHVWDSDEARTVVNAYKALEEALKQQSLQDLHDENERLGLYEQGEPIAHIVVSREGKYHSIDIEWSQREDKLPLGRTPIYTTPQQRKPLTDEQLKPHIQIAMKYYGYDETKYGLTTTSGFVWLARAIEAAHGIKE